MSGGLRGAGSRGLVVAAVAVVALSLALSSVSAVGSSGPVRLHGVMHVKTFTFRRGHSYVVTGNLTIVARGAVEIDAPVKIVAGRYLRILATGSIRNRAPITALPAPKPRQTQVEASRHPGCEAPPVVEKNAPENMFVEEKSSADMTISAPIVAQDGNAAAGNGCDGGSISLWAVGNMTIRARIKAGDGGPGGVLPHYPTPGHPGVCHTGGNADPTAFVLGGEGGDGGNIDIRIGRQRFVLGSLTYTPGVLEPGEGGRGGNVELFGANGGPKQSGTSIHAESGSGGRGGSASLYELESYASADYLYARSLASARGGAPGSVRAAAGDGGKPNCDGGKAVIRVGFPGAAGRGTHQLPAERAIVAVAGGDGAGPATSAGDPVGGHGGNVAVTPHLGAPRLGGYAHEKERAYVRSVVVVSAGDGGTGFDGCPVPTAGGAGGTAGDLQVNGALARVTDSFNGGHGGDGEGPGGGGPGGHHDFSIDSGPLVNGSFRNGDPGNPCRHAVRIDQFDTWAHNASLGKSTICINIATTPAQAFVSATLTGPGGYEGSLPKSPLHADGTAQITAPITQAGTYTDTLTVYDGAGDETQTAAATFTVAPPPENGPDPTFGAPCLAPTG